MEDNTFFRKTNWVVYWLLSTFSYWTGNDCFFFSLWSGAKHGVLFFRRVEAQNIGSLKLLPLMLFIFDLITLSFLLSGRLAFSLRSFLERSNSILLSYSCCFALMFIDSLHFRELNCSTPTQWVKCVKLVFLCWTFIQSAPLTQRVPLMGFIIRILCSTRPRRHWRNTLPRDLLSCR